MFDWLKFKPHRQARPGPAEISFQPEQIQAWAEDLRNDLDELSSRSSELREKYADVPLRRKRKRSPKPKGGD